MPTLDVFKGNAFNTISLTQSINKLPFKETRIKQLGIFAPKGVTTRNIMVEEKAGVLKLLEKKPWGSPADLNVPVKRTARSFAIPHFPLADTVMASDVVDLRPFGKETGEDTVAKKVNEKMGEMKQNHEITQEYLLATALQGDIKDGAGTTIYNLFTQFGVSQQTMDLLLGTASGVKAKFIGIKRLIQDELGALPFSYIHMLCGETLFDSIVGNDAIKEGYTRWLDSEFFRTDQRTGFSFCGIVMEEYAGKVGSTEFIANTEAYAFPVGCPNLFQMHYAPADYIETVGTSGLPYYAKQERMSMDKGILIETQSNPLPMCMIPRTCIKVTSST